ncbi:MAG: metallophosphoesterase family protein [Nitrososphaerota archaeon]|nr:metallophosphoesterase family protein [Nitrososphaerota archaeon]
MKAIIGTDFHGDQSSFKSFANVAEKEDVDVIIVCGDITNFGTPEDAKQLMATVTVINRLVLFVPGNCDPPSLTELKMDGAYCIHGTSFEFQGFNFIGLGGSPKTPFGTPLEMTEEEISRVLDAAVGSIINVNPIVLVSHSPPFNTRLDRTSLGIHVGSLSIRRFIEEKRPLAVFCGHIHEARGKDQIDGTVLVNPGPARHGSFVLARLNNNDVSLEFSTRALKGNI